MCCAVSGCMYMSVFIAGYTHVGVSGERARRNESCVSRPHAPASCRTGHASASRGCLRCTAPPRPRPPSVAARVSTPAYLNVQDGVAYLRPGCPFVRVAPHLGARRDHRIGRLTRRTVQRGQLMHAKCTCARIERIDSVCIEKVQRRRTGHYVHVNGRVREQTRDNVRDLDARDAPCACQHNVQGARGRRRPRQGWVPRRQRRRHRHGGGYGLRRRRAARPTSDRRSLPPQGAAGRAPRTPRAAHGQDRRARPGCGTWR